MEIEPTQISEDQNERSCTLPISELSDDALRKLSQVVEQPPEKIGSYRIVRKIGGGGMGVVYEAIEERLGRRVALKLIKPGYMSAEMLRRFEFEARLLARLEHPGIATIHFAGLWDAGAGPQPFFAMEFVEGKPLDQYRRDNRPRLKPRQIVELFHQICEAVQAAHAKGIVHRDLKPDNILIGADGRPKILDFGVARAINSDTQSTSLHTESGRIVGTVPYMAPEQIRGQVDELDQATDVYALGVIGYELLSDRMPYPVKDRPLPEAARIICENEPSRLSSINKSLSGDVETIVQKALEKEKARRYHTAGELASDVKRYLDYEPITARPPSGWYNLKKFAKRNKAVVAGLTAGMVALAAGAAVSTYFAITARQQRAEAEQRRAEAEAVNEFLTDDMLSGARPENMPDKTLREAIIAKLIEPAASRVGERFKGNPALEAAVRNTLALVFSSIGDPNLALSHAQQALELRRRALGNDHPETVNSMINLGATLFGLGRLSDAEVVLREALERGRRALGDDHPRTIGSINNLGYLYQARGKLAEAEPLLREALQRNRRVNGDGHQDTFTSLNNIGGLLNAQGKPSAAEPYYRECLERRRRVLGADHPDTLGSIRNLALILKAEGKLVDAEPLHRDALERHRRVLGDDHPDTIGVISNTASFFEDQGKLDQAEPLFREALERSRRILGNDHPDTLVAIDNMAGMLRTRGNFSEAESLYREVLDTSRRILGDDHNHTLVSISNLAGLLQAQGKLSAAEPLCREVLEGSRHNLGEDHPNTLLSMHSMATLLQAQGNFADAERLYRDALQRQRRVLGDDHPRTLVTIGSLGGMLNEQDRYAEAEPLFAELYQRALNAQVTPRRRALYISRWGPCLVKLNRHNEAVEPLRVAYDQLSAATIQQHPQFRAVLEALIEVARVTDHPQDATRWLAELGALQASTQPTTRATSAR